MLFKNRVFILLLIIISLAFLEKPISLFLMERADNVASLSIRFSDLDKAKQGFKVGEDITLIIENKGKGDREVELFYGEKRNYNKKNLNKIIIKAKSSEIFKTKILKSGRVYFYTRDIYLSSKVIK